jgi:hypothetical protein
MFKPVFTWRRIDGASPFSLLVSVGRVAWEVL